MTKVAEHAVQYMVALAMCASLMVLFQLARRKAMKVIIHHEAADTVASEVSIIYYYTRASVL